MVLMFQVVLLQASHDGASNNLELGRKPGGSNNLDGNLSNVAILEFSYYLKIK